MEEVIIKSQTHSRTKIIPIVTLIIGIISLAFGELTMSNRRSDLPILLFYLGICLILISILLFFYINSCELYVTKYRVYGKAAFGKRVDLPTDSISAIGMGTFQSLSISTSSGKISFLGIGNRNQIHKVISDIITSRNSQNTSNVSHTHKEVVSYTDELKNLKELLDAEIITQEEFDAKKKQLLNL